MAGAAYGRFLERLEGTRTLGVNFGLERVSLALVRLGSPQRKLIVLQVAGTNGKGSTAAMTDSILRAAGVRTGLFTSPHLSRFTERIRIDGAEVDGDRLADLDQRIVGTGVSLTYFEVATVLALLCMVEDKVEVAVLETGLGGRLDAVTTTGPVATAITSIGFDHMDLLGGTLAAIGREKAGIARKDVPLFVGPISDEAWTAVQDVAAEVGAPVHRFGIDFFEPFPPPRLLGAHQRTNAALAACLAGEALRALSRTLSPAAIERGLAAVTWPGRLEWLAPDLLLDCAHNVEGARSLLAALPDGRPRVLVTSIVRGKDVAGILTSLAPAFDHIVATQSHNPRALPVAELAALVARHAHAGGVEIIAEPWVALERARASAEGGYVVVAGSIFLVGELRARILGETADPPGGGDPLP